MRTIVRSALCGLALCATSLSAARSAAAGECAARAVAALRQASPNGAAILRRVGDAASFRAWLDCDDPQFGLPTAVHESVHLITAETDAYPLVGGGAVARPPEDRALFPPARIARRFRPGPFVEAYLRPGGGTSAADFRYLLDELNAYTHDLDAAVALDGLRDPDVRPAHREGLAALMSFVALYVEAAEDEPAARDALRRPGVAAPVTALWGQAERAMAASCAIPDIGGDDRVFLVELCAPGARAALKRQLGRAPLCPAACLAAPRTAGAD